MNLKLPLILEEPQAQPGTPYIPSTFNAAENGLLEDTSDDVTNANMTNTVAVVTKDLMSLDNAILAANLEIITQEDPASLRTGTTLS